LFHKDHIQTNVIRGADKLCQNPAKSGFEQYQNQSKIVNLWKV
jgi:hypothetical protein